MRLWTRDEVLAFIREHEIPYHALHNNGFASIGCAPCTRAWAPGEPESAGRWWWEHGQSRESGLYDIHSPQAAAYAPSATSGQEVTP